MFPLVSQVSKVARVRATAVCCNMLYVPLGRFRDGPALRLRCCYPLYLRLIDAPPTIGLLPTAVCQLCLIIGVWSLVDAAGPRWEAQSLCCRNVPQAVLMFGFDRAMYSSSTSCSSGRVTVKSLFPRRTIARYRLSNHPSFDAFKQVLGQALEWNGVDFVS